MYDDLFLMIKFCTNTCDTLGIAMDLLRTVPVIKVPNQRVKDMFYTKQNGELTRIPDILLNFRNSNGKEISAFYTKQGLSQVPLYSVLNPMTVNTYGIPYLDKDDLYADAIFLDNYWYQKIM